MIQRSSVAASRSAIAASRSEPERLAWRGDREPEPSDEPEPVGRHFLVGPRRCIISLRACATTADGTPFDLERFVRSFSRRNGRRRIASVTVVFGLRHSEYLMP